MPRSPVPRPASQPILPLTRRLWFLGLLGILPALLLGAFGLHALRREEDLAVIDARRLAPEVAARVAAAVNDSLTGFLNLGADEVRALADGARRGQHELLSHMAFRGDFRFFAASWSYPPDPGDLSGTTEWESQSWPDPIAEAWQDALRAERDPARREEALQRWSGIVDLPPPTESGLLLARFHLGRCLVQAGRTGEAAPLLQAVVSGGARLRSSTGLPLDVLAARALLQAAEVDTSLAERRSEWLGLLAERALVRGWIPEALARELESDRGQVWSEWQEVARRYEVIRRALPRVQEAMQTAWIPEKDASVLRMVHRVEGGTWVGHFPEVAVSNLVTQPILAAELPAGIGVVVQIAGRRLGAEGGEVLASATFSGLNAADSGLSVLIADPAVFHALTRLRARVLAVLIGVASLGCVAAVVAALRAYHRERQLALQQADFVASVSHELRAPLAAVRLMAEEMMDAPAPPEAPGSHYPKLILREAQRLGRLVENVLRHARMEQRGGGLERRATDLREVLTMSLENLRPAASDRGVRLEAELPADPVIARVDSHALQQVVINLVDNAVKHSPDGAVVRVGLSLLSSRTSSPSHGSGSRSGTSGQRARLWVSDQGSGIPHADHARIFERFYRRGTELRRETAGVGLGLALVKRLVEAHDGSISLESEPGHGATFTVTLPLESSL